jgi:predicted XRE-type DNA-binding protein
MQHTKPDSLDAKRKSMKLFMQLRRPDPNLPQAARKLGISQPRLSEITRGKVELLSLDYLVGLCANAEIPVKMRLAA